MELAAAIVAGFAAIIVAMLNRKPPGVITETTDEIDERDDLIHALQLALRHCLEEHV